jgi:hypothetical protein
MQHPQQICVYRVADTLVQGTGLNWGEGAGGSGATAPDSKVQGAAKQIISITKTRILRSKFVNY